MRKVIVHGAWLVAVAALVAGCGPAKSSNGGSPTPSSSVTAQPSNANTAASNPSAAPANVPTGGPQYPTGTASATAPASTAADTGALGGHEHSAATAKLTAANALLPQQAKALKSES